MTYINIIIIGAIYVFILDISGAWSEITSMISGWITGGKIVKPINIKPFSCSLCMTFWTSLIYLAISHRLPFYTFAFGCLVAFLTPRIKDILLTLDSLLCKLINLINK